jgi:hypothetical protein
MTLRLGLIVLGAALLYAGWKNLSVQALFFGDNTTPKTPVSTSPPSSSGGGSGSGGSSSSTGSGAGASSAPVGHSVPSIMGG